MKKIQKFNFLKIALCFMATVGIFSIEVANKNKKCEEVKAESENYCANFESKYAQNLGFITSSYTNYTCSMQDEMNRQDGGSIHSFPGNPSLHFDAIYKNSEPGSYPYVCATSDHSTYGDFYLEFGDTTANAYSFTSFSVCFEMPTSSTIISLKSFILTYYSNDSVVKTVDKTSSAAFDGTVHTISDNFNPADKITKVQFRANVAGNAIRFGIGAKICAFTSGKVNVHVHERVFHERVAPTCTKSGMKEYYSCDCGLLFVNNGGVYSVTTANELVLDPTGHNWSTPTYTWASDADRDFTCVSSRYCQNEWCKDVETSVAQTITKQITIMPSSQLEGEAKITATFEEATVFSPSTKVISLPIFDNYVSDAYQATYNWFNDASTGTLGCQAKMFAKVDLEGDDYALLEITSEYATVTSEITLPPTCVATGIETYTATFTKEYFKNGSTKEVTLPINPEGHDWKNPIYEWHYPDNDIPYCTAKIICNLDETHIEIITGTTFSEIRTVPTLSTPGKIIYVAKFYDIRCENQEISSLIDPLNPNDFDVNYVWKTNPDSSIICTGYAKNKIDNSIIYTETGTTDFIVDKKCTCKEDGFGHYEATFKTSSLFNKQIRENKVTIPTPGEHVYYDYWIYDKMPTSTDTVGYRSHHCMFCDSKKDIETIEFPSDKPEEIIELCKNVVEGIVRPEDMDEEYEIEKALEEIPQEALIEITGLVGNETNDLNKKLEEGLISKEEYEHKMETVQAVSKSSLIIASQQESAIKEGKIVAATLPKNKTIDLGNKINDFYTRQMDILLNKKPQANDPILKLLHINDDEEGGINYDISPEAYNKAVQFVDESVAHMESSSTRLRECSNEKITTTIEVYITTIQYSSFQDFDKEKADNEFVKNAYEAIMLQMQSEVLNQLEEELKKTSSQIEKDPAKENLIKEQIESVNDFEQFEIMVKEVLRQNYNTITGYDIALEDFNPIFETMFRRYALNEEQDVDITLEDLTKAVTDKKVNKDCSFNVNTSSLGNSEIIFFSCLGGGLGLILILGITLYVVGKKKMKGGE